MAEGVLQLGGRNISFIGRQGFGKTSTVARIIVNAGGFPELNESSQFAEDKLAQLLDTPEELDLTLFDHHARGKTVMSKTRFVKHRKQALSLTDNPNVLYMKTVSGIKGLAQADVAVIPYFVKLSKPEEEVLHFYKCEEELKLCRALKIPSIVLLEDDEKFDVARKLVEASGCHPVILRASALRNINVDNGSQPLMEAIQNIARVVYPHFSTRIPVLEHNIKEGKISGIIGSGKIHIGGNLLLMPQEITVTIENIWCFGILAKDASAGDYVEIKVRGANEDLRRGQMLCSIGNPCIYTHCFKAKIYIKLEQLCLFCVKSFLDNKCFVIRYLGHSRRVEMDVINVTCTATGIAVTEQYSEAVKDVTVEVLVIIHDSPLCMEIYGNVPKLGQFLLFDATLCFLAGGEILGEEMLPSYIS